MLTYADIEALLNACYNTRDRAAIALRFDVRLRGSELYELTVGDISGTQHGLSVRVTGKTGERSVLLIPSIPYVRQWLEQYSEDVDAPLWSRLHSSEQLTYDAFLKVFKESADRAGVEKPVTPMNLRKSNLAWLVRQGMNARLIEQRQGHAPRSDSVSRYVALFDADIDEESARLMG